MARSCFKEEELEVIPYLYYSRASNCVELLEIVANAQGESAIPA